MRSTRQQKKQKRRQKRVQVGIALFLALLMLTSIASYFAGTPTSYAGSQGTVTDLGVEFDVIDQSGVTQLIGSFSGQEFAFSYLPSQANSISSLDTSGAAALLEDANYALTFMPSNQDAQLLDYARYVLSSQVPLQLQPIVSGIASSNEQYSALPVVTCENQEGVTVLLTMGNTTETTVEGSCITIQGNAPSQILAAVDAIRYAQLGVYS